MANSKSLASDEAERLQSVLKKYGIDSVIQLRAGRTSNIARDPFWIPKHSGLLTNWVGVMNHHTAGPKTGNTPSLNVVSKGRSDLPGPLCNGYGGRNLKYYIIVPRAMANHPGLGGACTLGKFRVPEDSARPWIWGTEWEHDGVSKWDEEMRYFMGLANHGLLEWMGLPDDRSLEHKTWAPTRKIDRNGYTAKIGQDEIRWALKRWKDEEEMPTAKDVVEELLKPENLKLLARGLMEADAVSAPTTELDKKNTTWRTGSFLRETVQSLARIEQALSKKA